MHSKHCTSIIVACAILAALNLFGAGTLTIVNESQSPLKVTYTWKGDAIDSFHIYDMSGMGLAKGDFFGSTGFKNNEKPSFKDNSSPANGTLDEMDLVFVAPLTDWSLTLEYAGHPNQSASQMGQIKYTIDYKIIDPPLEITPEIKYPKGASGAPTAPDSALPLGMTGLVLACVIRASQRFKEKAIARLAI